MKPAWSLTFESHLAAPADRVWEHASSMDGVNRELAPYLRMSVPGRMRGLRLTDAPVGRPLFGSWLLAGGLLPFDRHRLRLEAIGPGRRFLERSTSWTSARWEHERTVEPEGSGCRVVDRLGVTPRLPLATPVVRRVVQALFTHRHERLRDLFGRAPAREARP